MVRRHLTGGKLGKKAAAVSALTWQAPVALALAFPPTRLRHAAVYAAQMWAYVAHYDMPDDDPDLMARRLRVKYPIKVDRLIGFGQIPTVRLQRRLGKKGRVLRHDTFLSWLHWSWFLVPHGSVAYVLWRRPERFAHAAGMMAGTFDAGVAGYWLRAAPPPGGGGGNRPPPPPGPGLGAAGGRGLGGPLARPF